MTRTFWKAPELFPKSTIVLVGGGPSLIGFDFTPVRESGCPVIVANSSIFTVPWADILYFGDRRWWRWNVEEKKGLLPEEFKGRVITSSCATFADGRVLRMNKSYEPPISHDRTALFGLDSGCQAMNLAYHLGGIKLVLLGYDMGFAPDGKAHHHDEYPVESTETNYINKFTPQYAPLVEALKKVNVEVVRCTPSRLDFIPQVSIEEALA